ncbi:MAG: adenylyl-sulfate kinase [Candidatus Lokiarchaeota archaeon]|nr:adenylyl-sulfate kinase [Candidatus Lokiarchaeota archaeon]
MLVIFSGIPASGKSTFANEIKKQLEKHRGVVVEIVDSDEIRRKVYNIEFDPSMELFIKDQSLYRIDKYLKQGYHVISDDLNYYQSMRHELKEIARENRTVFLIIYFEITLEEALKRNEERGLPIPQNVIEKIYEKFDKPGQKYKWDNYFYKVTGANPPKEEAIKLAEKLRPYLYKKLEILSIREQAELGLAEEIDKITRDLVSGYIELHGENPKEISKFRKEFLKHSLEESYNLKAIKEKFYKFLDEKFGKIKL